MKNSSDARLGDNRSRIVELLYVWRHDCDRASRSRKCGGNELASCLVAGMADVG